MEKRRKRKKGVKTLGPAMMVDNMKGWETEEDLRAVARAAAVQKDPKRMEAVKALAKQKLEDSKRR